jgi:hypothetical protein
MRAYTWLRALCLVTLACGVPACGDDDGAQGDPCDENPCLRTGTCTESGGGFACDCPSGWTGDRCDVSTSASEQAALDSAAAIIYLHHSTGGVIWDGGVSAWVDAYNDAEGTSYAITERAFPADDPYGWANYPYDYWNIWVSHAGTELYLEEPTLELLTADYDVVVWKHCFPVSGMEEDTGSPDPSSETKSRENYELQYAALKDKMHEFPDTRFLVWTGAALRVEDTSPEQAERARDFARWVIEEWDEPGDNIFVWDFRYLETEGGLYLRLEHSAGDSHPDGDFAVQVAPLFGRRLVDVIEGRGDVRSLTGE